MAEDSLLRARAGVAGLPVWSLVGELREALARTPEAVLQAPPGSGKTTLLPLLLRDEEWLSGKKILLLEPRRLAARAAARRMAGLLGEPVGKRVGYRVRHDTVVGPETRIEVVTDGILTRIVQHDPELAGYGLIIFDEFHERHLQADLGLALVSQVRELFRPEMRVLVMSATLAAAEVAGFLGGAPLLKAEGETFPVDTIYLGEGPPGFSLEHVYRAVLRALDETSGDLLVFLPGAGEIRRLEKRLAERLAAAGAAAEHELLPLFGELPPEKQELVFSSGGGRRRIILATDIAESSLTVPGVRVVVDCGFRRSPRFDAAAGMGRLETVSISRAAADQRRGRAGREAAGVCYRLWSREGEAGMAAFSRPEILVADLAPLALELALWGVREVEELAFLTPPPAAALAQARVLLEKLGALDSEGRVTGPGREMAGIGLHPRLARMVLAGGSRKAAGLAALLELREPMAVAGSEPDSDLDHRLERLRACRDSGSGPELKRGYLSRWRRETGMIVRQAGIGRSKKVKPDLSCGELLALAYPDRIAKKRSSADQRYLLSNGREAFFAEPEPLASCGFLVVAELDGRRRSARIRRAAAYSEASLRKQFAAELTREEEIVWDAASRTVRAVTRTRFGALVLSEEKLRRPDPERLAGAWLEGLARQGLSLLDFDARCRLFCTRVEFVRSLEGVPDIADWPSFSDEALLAEARLWLAGALGEIRSREQLKKLRLLPLLRNRLGGKACARLDELAPESLSLPGGRRATLEYQTAGEPVLAVRLQELFGWDETPRVAGGRVPVLLRILSPARRPIQVTSDLAGFWRGSYAEVRKEMRGRYPKHVWPERPWERPPIPARRR